VDPDAFELLTAVSATSISGAIRVPPTAIRGLGAETVRHILQMRAVFGPFTSLLYFLRRMEPQQINRRELQVVIRLGAFSFTGRSRAQLALVENIYASAGELLRATDRDPADLAHLEDDLPEMLGCHTTAVEWPPERVAADELAHLGFYVVPHDVQQHALRIAEEFSTLDIAALAGQQHNTVVSIAGVITTLRIRQTKKGEQMAWLTLTDGTGAIECAIFPTPSRASVSQRPCSARAHSWWPLASWPTKRPPAASCGSTELRPLAESVPGRKPCAPRSSIARRIPRREQRLGARCSRVAAVDRRTASVARQAAANGHRACALRNPTGSNDSHYLVDAGVA